MLLEIFVRKVLFTVKVSVLQEKEHGDNKGEKCRCISKLKYSDSLSGQGLSLPLCECAHYVYMHVCVHMTYVYINKWAMLGTSAFATLDLAKPAWGSHLGLGSSPVDCQLVLIHRCDERQSNFVY